MAEDEDQDEKKSRVVESSEPEPGQGGEGRASGPRKEEEGQPRPEEGPDATGPRGAPAAPPPPGTGRPGVDRRSATASRYTCSREAPCRARSRSGRNVAAASCHACFPATAAPRTGSRPCPDGSSPRAPRRTSRRSSGPTCSPRTPT